MRYFVMVLALVVILVVADSAQAGGRVAIASSNGFCNHAQVPQNNNFAIAGRGFAVAGNGNGNVAISQRRGLFPIFPLSDRRQNIAISNGNVSISGRR